MIHVDLDDYKNEFVNDAWKLADEHIKEAQQRQYDQQSKELHLKVRDRVMVYMTLEKKGRLER